MEQNYSDNSKGKEFKKFVENLRGEDIDLLYDIPHTKWLDINLDSMKYMKKLSKHYSYDPKKNFNIITHDDETYMHGNYNSVHEYVYVSKKKLEKVGSNKEYEIVYDNKTQQLFINILSYHSKEGILHTAETLSQYCQDISGNSELTYHISKNTKTDEHEISIPGVFVKNFEEKKQLLTEVMEYGDMPEIKCILQENCKNSKTGYVKRTPLLNDYYEGENKKEVIEADLDTFTPEDFPGVMKRIIMSECPISSRITINGEMHININIKGDVGCNKIINNYINTRKSNSDVVKDFVEHVKTKKPSWYCPGEYVKTSFIKEKVDEFIDADIPQTTVTRITNASMALKKERKNGIYYLLLKDFANIN